MDHCLLCFIQLVVNKAELERMKVENQRLKEMLNQVTTNYNALQMHLMTLLQAPKAENTEENGRVDEKVVEGKNNGGLIVPRQFMDLGLAANGDTDENSVSSSEGRSRERSGSPGNNGELASKKARMIKDGISEERLVFDQENKKEYGRGDNGREESPGGQTSQGWGPNKVPRFNSPKNVDQTEATMRKARVSVRARSEAPMVGGIYIYL